MSRRGIAVLLVSIVVCLPLYLLDRIDADLRSSRSRRPSVGMRFPKLSLDLSSEVQGPSPDDPSERLRVVSFVRAGCARCERTLATLHRLSNDYESTPAMLAIVFNPTGIELGETHHGVHSVVDLDGSLSARFGVLSVPLTFVLDEGARIVAVVEGERSESVWRTLLLPGAHDA